MKSMIAAGLTVVSMLVVCSGCGDSRESLAEDGMSAMKQMVAALETVKDEASAKAAKPEIQALAKQLDDLNKRQEKLGTPSDEEIKALLDKHGDEMEDLTRKLTSQMLRIAFDPKIQAVLGDIDFKSTR